MPPESAVIAPSSPSARPPAPVNPVAQPRPVRPAIVKAPTERQKPVGPDLSKVPPVPTSAGLRDGIKKLFSQGETPPASIASDPNPPAPPPDAPVAPEAAKIEPVKPNAGDIEPVKPKETAEPKEAPPVAAPDDVAPPDNLSAEGLKGWKALKEQRDNLKKELGDAQSHLETLKKATPAQVEEVEKLKSDYKALKDRMAVIDLPSTPEYFEQYTKPKDAALAEAKEVLNYNGKEQADLKAILGLPQKDFTAKVAEMTKDMNVVDANIVINGMRSAYKISGQEREALSMAGDLKAGIEAKYAAQNKAAFEEVYKVLDVDSVMKPFDIPAGISAENRREIESANAELAKVRASAETNAFGRMTPKSAATMALKAALFDQHMAVRAPIIQKGMAALKSQLAAAHGELSAIKAAKGTGSFTAPAGKDGPAPTQWDGPGGKKESLLREAYGKK